jgi:hypothetical protein
MDMFSVAKGPVSVRCDQVKPFGCNFLRRPTLAMLIAFSLAV